MRPGLMHAWLASATELGAGGLLLIGLLTPLAAAGTLGVMVVAWVTNHWRNGFFIFRPGEGYEYVMTLAVCSAAVAMVGPGRYSVDYAVGIFNPPGWRGVILALAGCLAAVLLLVMCWRPERDRPSA
jgi:putative oxidoreductase